MLTHSKLPGIFIILLILFISLAIPAWAGSPVEETVVLEPVQAGTDDLSAQNSPLSTPELLQQAVDNGVIDKDTYLLYLYYALSDYTQLPPEYLGSAPWDGTRYVLQLQQEASNVKDPNKREKIVVQAGACGGESGAGQADITNSTHFYIQYDAASVGGGLTIDDYVNSLETYAWDAAIVTYGWAAPPVSASPPPGNRYHVVIAPLGPGLYGYVATGGKYTGLASGTGDNPHTTWVEQSPYESLATCMVLNDDYSGFPGTPRAALDATTSHEFHHSLQYGYGALSPNDIDDNFVEGSATWMEDESNDASNDNYNYLWPDFSACMGEHSGDSYSYWLTFRGLTERYGTTQAGGSEQVMQNYWEIVSNPTARTTAGGVMLNALDVALGMPPASTNLPDAFHTYAIAAKFMKTCGEDNYGYPYCFEEASDYITAMGEVPGVHGTVATVENSYSGGLENNYTINWIALPTNAPAYAITLQNTSSSGQLRGSVVCDTGTELKVASLSSVVGAGNSTTLPDIDPGGCTSLVAVITNQEQTADNPASCRLNSYKLNTFISSGSSNAILYLPLVLK